MKIGTREERFVPLKEGSTEGRKGWRKRVEGRTARKDGRKELMTDGREGKGRKEERKGRK